jgi:hypothetical protein
MREWSHGEKEVRKALTAAATAGLRVTDSAHAHGHSWGYIDCMHEDCEGRLYIWSSPPDPAETAKKIGRFIKRHDHKEE